MRFNPLYTRITRYKLQINVRDLQQLVINHFAFINKFIQTVHGYTEDSLPTVRRIMLIGKLYILVILLADILQCREVLLILDHLRDLAAFPIIFTAFIELLSRIIFKPMKKRHGDRPFRPLFNLTWRYPLMV